MKMSNDIRKTDNSVNNLNQTLVDFLRKYQIKKDDKEPKQSTNTRIADTKLSIYGGNYHIPDDKYEQFLNLYYRDVLSKNGNEYLTEVQLDEGPIVIDMDLKYSMEIKERQHTKEHIQDLVVSLLDIIKDIYQLDDESKIPVYVLEKTKINILAEKKIVKDGIHMIIGVNADKTVRRMFRERAIKEVAKLWEDLPITNVNGWDDVFDEGVSSGHTNWQLFGSRKPNHDAYKLTYIYHGKYDPSDEEISIPPFPLKSFDIANNIQLLSVRYRNHPTFLLKSSFIEEYNQYKNFRGGNLVSNVKTKSINNDFTDFELSDINSYVSKITNATELEFILNMFLDKITTNDYELKEAYSYTMTLPEQYYVTPGSFDKWIRVGWVLKHISNKLLIVWIAFSAQDKNFNYADIPELCNKWKKFDGSKQQGLQKRSLMYWSKQDSNEKYKKVHEESVDYFLEQTISGTGLSVNVGNNKKQKAVGGDFDIARVLFQMYKDRFVCTSVKSNTWYEFKKHRWVEIDSGTTLRKLISTELREIYNKKAVGSLNRIMNLANNVPSVNVDTDENNNMTEEEEKKKTKDNRTTYILEICARLSRTSDKKNIMTEAKELFYDGTFMNKLDTNPYLLCFKNGVVDFKEKCFRPGRPEDNISMSTNINYRPLDLINDKEIIDSCTDFLHKLFPEEELYNYMYDHLASTLIGTSSNQTFNMYIGKGRNGKSALVGLMVKVLGEYQCVVASTMITEGRAKVGSVSPEVLQLKGKRYGVIQEPSPGEKINVGVMKQLTSGNDAIQARGLYKSEATTFIPQMKLVLCSNYMMKVESNDYGTWRRIRVVPYKSKFDENPVTDDPENPYQYKLDPNIEENFDNWKETFAAMLVQRVFETNGIVKDCPIVLAASNEYRASQDYIAEYIRDKIVKDPNGKIKKTALNIDFSSWYMETYGSRGTPPPPKDVHDYMDKQFGTQKNQAWTGVRIRYNERDDLNIPEDEDIDDGIDISEL